MIDLGGAITPHLPVIFGLTIGTLAKYGQQLEEGAPIHRSKVLGHLMMLGVLGLLAEAAAESAHLAPYWRALASAGAALSAAKVVRRYRMWVERETDRRLPLPPTPDEKVSE